MGFSCYLLILPTRVPETVLGQNVSAGNSVFACSENFAQVFPGQCRIMLHYFSLIERVGY